MADTTPAKATEPVVPETKPAEVAAPSAPTPEAPQETPSAEATAPAPIAPAAEAPKEIVAQEAPKAVPAEALKETEAKTEPEVKAAELESKLEASTPADAPAAAPAADAAAAAATAPAATSETPAEKSAEKSAEEAAPAEPVATVSSDGWPVLKEDHPLSKLLSELPAILKEADYNEVYGLTIGGDNTFHTKLILQKFLRANANDLAKAKEQLLGTLKWRKEYKPLEAVEEFFTKDKFGGLGFVTLLDDVPGEADKKAVVTFNLYGAVKDNKATFGDFDGFLRWRVALMELGLQKLELGSAKTPLPDHGAGADPYQGYQVHDYMNVSFLRQDPDVKAASKKTIETFSKYYPETLSRKFFVNVPLVMGWVFTAVKMLLSKETVRKFTVLTYGKDLAGELGPNVPEVYGGKAESLESIASGPKLE